LHHQTYQDSIDGASVAIHNNKGSTINGMQLDRHQPPIRGLQLHTHQPIVVEALGP